MFVRAASPIWLFVDLTGSILNDQYWAFFEENVLPYNFQPVYQDPAGTTPWSDPIQFYPNGTLPDNLYFNPNLVYRIEIRQGPTQTDPLIYQINNFVPGGSSSSISTNFANSQNIVVDSQFQNVSFASPFTYTQGSSGTYTVPVAPGWTLVLTGAGTTVLTQELLAGNNNIVGNPPSFLNINNTGWTTAKLIYTVNDNGAIFANGGLVMSLLARSYGSAQNITTTYNPSGIANPQEFFAALSIPTSVFTLASGFIQPDGAVKASVNTNTGDAAYVQFIITLPPTGQMDFTNIQILGQEVPLPDGYDNADIPPFQEITPQQQINNQFFYYKNELVTKPKGSILTGWNFPLNPYQFVDPSSLMTQTSQTVYIADQTILHQETASSVETGKAAAINRYGLQVQQLIDGPTNRIALIQYIDPTIVLPYWNNYLASLVRVFLHSSGTPQVYLKMRLIYRSTLPSTIGNAEPIASWADGADPTFSAGWTQIVPLNDPEYLLPVNGYSPYEGTDAFPSYSFDEMLMPVCGGNTQTLGIVLYTMNAAADANPMLTGDYLVFDRVSLVPNKFGVDAEVETFDESLRRCQFYYEKSYAPGSNATTTTNNDAIFAEMFTNGSSSPINLYTRGFNVNFSTTKRATPSAINIYSPTAGTIANVDGYINNNGALNAATLIPTTNWSVLSSSGQKNFSYIPSNATPFIGLAASNTVAEAFIMFHFTANSCLGNPTLP